MRLLKVNPLFCFIRVSILIQSCNESVKSEEISFRLGSIEKCLILSFSLSLILFMKH